MAKTVDVRMTEAERRAELREFEDSTRQAMQLIRALHDGKATTEQQHEAAHMLHESIKDCSFMQHAKAAIVEAIMAQLGFGDEPGTGN